MDLGFEDIDKRTAVGTELSVAPTYTGLYIPGSANMTNIRSLKFRS